ncbi:beta-galactosidase [Parapedobacter sp. 10938]|uniref:beta-galactosidase n=1 Tax=Parapedobacter flavus TaxID=3110225 RepID=UPI002DB88AF5|nr:beta-galactosidase [Parapedobacter sp. 10938]MEC3879455.1 beta-galactosidase [Parapedobacter sp. 10938]
MKIIKSIRMNMKYLLLFVSLTGYSSLLVAQQQANTVEQIPILAWYGVSPEESTVERYEELRQSGITHNFTFFSSVDELAVAMESAQKAGIKMIIHCPELATEPEKIVRRFKDHPALAGYFLRDEPGRADFPELGEWARRIQAVDDEHFCYLNLFPNYASKEALGTETYREHVQLFIEEVPLQLLSFDHYPIVVDGSGNRTMRPEYYENLAIFSDEADKAGKPFWAFALAVAHEPYPIPTPAEIRVQVYSNLAYGAQGIQYFTYWTPKPGTWDFHHAPIDYDTQKRTEVYDYITQMNREIRGLSKVFLNAKVISVAHTGDSIPRGTHRLEKLPDVITKFETEGTGAVVSLLKNENTSYLVIVNRDFQKSMSVTIEGDERLKRVLKNGRTVDADAYISTLPVAPGDILVYAWQP